MGIDSTSQLVLAELEKAEQEHRWPGLGIAELEDRLSRFPVRLKNLDQLKDAVHDLASAGSIVEYLDRWYRPVVAEAVKPDQLQLMSVSLAMNVYSIFGQEPTNDGISRAEIDRILRLQGATFSSEALDWCLRRALGSMNLARFDEASGLYYPRVHVTSVVEPVGFAEPEPEDESWFDETARNLFGVPDLDESLI